MGESEQPVNGVIERLRKLCGTGVGLLQTRVELFAVELREEKARLVKLFVFAVATVFLGMMALTLVTVTVIILTWDHAQVPVLVGLSLFYLLAASVAFLALWKHIHAPPLPFNETVAELKKDRECLDSRK